jgi:hypothetical protein
VSTLCSVLHATGAEQRRRCLNMSTVSLQSRSLHRSSESFLSQQTSSAATCEGSPAPLIAAPYDRACSSWTASEGAVRPDPASLHSAAAWPWADERTRSCPSTPLGIAMTAPSPSCRAIVPRSKDAVLLLLESLYTCILRITMYQSNERFHVLLQRRLSAHV